MDTRCNAMGPMRFLNVNKSNLTTPTLVKLHDMFEKYFVRSLKRTVALRDIIQQIYQRFDDGQLLWCEAKILAEPYEKKLKLRLAEQEMTEIERICNRIKELSEGSIKTVQIKIEKILEHVKDRTLKERFEISEREGWDVPDSWHLTLMKTEKNNEQNETDEEKKEKAG